MLGILLALSCIILYSNSLSNGYCLDDAMMITENEITQKGFGGIKEHMEHSFLYGFMHQEGYDAGSSHWRPLVMISFAVEVGLWGIDKPGNSHVVNLLIYIGIVLFLFHLLRRYLLKDLWLAFFTALIYAIHPIHTEVVANIKGRDEMLSLLFVLISLRQLWKFTETKKLSAYLFSLASFFIAMSAKENSLTFLAGIPLMLYYFSDLSLKKILTYSSGFLITTVIFIIIRNAIVPLSNSGMSNEITNNPYLYAKGLESISTKVYVLLLMLKLTLLPYPLRYDYSYNHIPYVNASNPWVWISLAIYAGMFIYAMFGIRSKNIISFAILMFFVTFSVNTNIVVETGVMMAERMLFTPTIFTALILAVLGKRLIAFAEQRSIAKPRVAAAILTVPLFIACAIIIIDRNKDWKNDTTLNLADVVKCPESARVNGGAGTASLALADQPGRPKDEKDSLTRQAIRYYTKSVSIHPGYNDPWMNMGVAYSRIDSIFKSEECWNRARKNNPDVPKLVELDRFLANTFFTRGLAAEGRNQLDSAVLYYKKADTYSRQNDSTKLKSLYNMAGTYYRRGDYQNAMQALEKVMKINPNFLEVKKGYEACLHFLQQQGTIPNAGG